jgi:hypothetical protein
MVKLQIMNNSQYESERTSLSWDKTRKPSKSILKNTKHQINYYHNHNHNKHKRVVVKQLPSSHSSHPLTIPMPIPLEVNDLTNEKSSNDETIIQDLLENMTISSKKEPEIIEQNIIKVSKLYCKFDYCSYYDVSTSFTIQNSLSYFRINKILNNEALINVVDIYNLPSLILALINQHQGVFQNRNENNDFFCNSYWVIYLLYSITNLVFEKLGINRNTYLTFEPNKTDFKNCDIKEHTHIIRHQLSVCEWLLTTTGPSYLRNDVPHELGRLLVKELIRLYNIIDSNEQSWLNNSISLLC